MKKPIKKAIKYFSIIIVVIVMLPFLAFGGLLLFVPISRPNDSVRNYVLRQIPMGTSWDDTIEIIDKKGWIIEQTDIEHGLIVYDAAGSAMFADDLEMEFREKAPSESRVVGTKAMFVELGEFYGPFYTAVFVWLAFDENNGLVEAVIRRDIDAL